MNQQQKDAWLAALRSGQYQQQRRAALKTVDGYCCLGVVNEVLDLQSTSAAFLRGPRGKVIFIPFDIQMDLATMNDSTATFAEIADHIEQHVPPTE